VELSALPVEICRDIADAIDAATREKFSVIAVVISGLSARLETILKALNQVGSGAKIVLLAQMYEEPIAKRLTSISPNGKVDFAEQAHSTGSGRASSYLMCPIEAQKFYQAVLHEETDAASSRIDEQTSARIRLLEKLATTDELTGLKNRRYLWEFSRQIMELAKAEKGRVTLLVFDIDDFKHYNDKYGHLTGDNILKQAAVLMQRSCREHDVVGRIGGDEFAVVFWDGPHKEGADESSERRSAQAEHPREAIFIAKRFQKALEDAELNLLGPRGKGVLTISGGLASFPRDGSTVDELFEQADKALLEAKRSGKNRIYLVGSPQGDISKIE
jgi:diguanylate cyclase (GGDEF)-like protein